MESLQIFTVAVLAVCAIHLVSTISARIFPWWEETVRRKDSSFKSSKTASSRIDLLQEIPIPQRSDWYVFFHCADLVGREPQKKMNPRVRLDRTGPGPGPAEHPKKQINRSIITYRARRSGF